MRKKDYQLKKYSFVTLWCYLDEIMIPNAPAYFTRIINN